jgi:hypothetical protein
MEWMDNLPDELKDNKSLQAVGSLEGLAKAFIDTKATVGNSIRIAGPDATAEAKAEVYNKVISHMPELMLKPNPDNSEQMTEYHRMLGVPENIDGYDAAEIKLDENIVSELKQLAFKTNMTKKQFQAYAMQMAEMNDYTQQQKEDSRTRMGAELKTEWGMAFEDRYAVVEKHLAENPDLGSIEGMTPGQVRGHYAIATSLRGTSQAHNQPNTPSNTMTPDEARAQIDEINQNPIFMDGFTNPVEHKRLMMKRIELMKMSDPQRYS